MEDDPVYRNSMARLLRHSGHEVIAAKDGDEALEVLSNDLLLPPWVIVTDLRMPGRSGSELIAELRTTTHLRNIPIVVITGLAPEDRPELAAELVMVKPVTHQQLHERLCKMAPTYGQPAPEALLDETA